MTPYAEIAQLPNARGGLMLDVRDIGVVFDGETFFEKLSLHVASAEIVSLVGPSGSGKTTLLRAIAGLHKLASGAIFVDDRDITKLPTHRRGVGLVFQDNQLFTHLTVGENIAYSLRVARVSKSMREQRVREMLALVGLDGFASRTTMQLSGGEAKRVAVARSLVADPRVLLLDEPLTGLDAELQHRLLADISQILRARKTTVVHVTHDHEEARSFSDRIVDIRSLSR